MRQIVLQRPGEFLESTAQPPRRLGEMALVRVRSIGVCGTDLHAFAGRQPFFEYPRILGHELGVEVVELPPSVEGLQPGDRCAVEPYLNCRECPACRRGKTNCCESLQCLGVHCDGGMRPLISVPVRLLHKSDTLSLDELALVETLGIGAQAVRRAALEPGETVLVAGAGPIGLAAIQFAQAAGADITVLELSETRRRFVERWGVRALAEPDGQLYDAVFDATGNAASMEQSFAHVAHGGRLVLVGIVQGRIGFDDPSFHRRELTLLASRNSAGMFPDIIRMIEQRRIDTRPWITHHMTLAQVPSHFPQLRQQPGLVKAVIHTEEDDL